MKAVDLQYKDKGFVIVHCEDGSATIDRRVYEQKLGTLCACTSIEQVIELAESSTEYLKEHYKTDDIIAPKRW